MSNHRRIHSPIRAWWRARRSHAQAVSDALAAADAVEPSRLDRMDRRWTPEMHQRLFDAVQAFDPDAPEGDRDDAS